MAGRNVDQQAVVILITVGDRLQMLGHGVNVPAMHVILPRLNDGPRLLNKGG